MMAKVRRAANDEPPGLLSPAEVARLFNVEPKTVSRWATIGKLRSMRTLGGHRRFFADEVYELLRATRAAQGSRDHPRSRS
ncbi:BldC family transcriptional regulator [Isoptericola sp. NPDC055881]